MFSFDVSGLSAIGFCGMTTTETGIVWTAPITT
jgi:hypothetical protein